MNSERKNQSPNKTDSSVEAATDQVLLKDFNFEAWLDRELEILEERFADFATAKSTRLFFSRK